MRSGAFRGFPKLTQVGVKEGRAALPTLVSRSGPRLREHIPRLKDREALCHTGPQEISPQLGGDPIQDRSTRTFDRPRAESPQRLTDEPDSQTSDMTGAARPQGDKATRRPQAGLGFGETRLCPWMCMSQRLLEPTVCLKHKTDISQSRDPATRK